MVMVLLLSGPLAADGRTVLVCFWKIIIHNSASVFGRSNNGSICRNASLYANRRATKLFSSRRRPWLAAIFCDRCAERLGGSIRRALVAQNDSPSQSNAGRGGVLSALHRPDCRS